MIHQQAPRSFQTAERNSLQFHSIHDGQTTLLL